MLKEVEMINISDKGKLLPLRFRVDIDGQLEVVKVAMATFVEENNMCGNRMQIFRCRVANKGYLKDMKIFYEVDSCKWLIEN